MFKTIFMCPLQGHRFVSFLILATWLLMFIKSNLLYSFKNYIACPFNYFVLVFHNAIIFLYGFQSLQPTIALQLIWSSYDQKFQFVFDKFDLTYSAKQLNFVVIASAVFWMLIHTCSICFMTSFNINLYINSRRYINIDTNIKK